MILHSKPSAFTFGLLLTSALVLALAGGFVWDVVKDLELDRANELREVSLAHADEFRDSTNDLNRMATNYIVTGDPIFKTYYNDIVSIRDGRMPRPNGYGGAYWDSIVAKERSPDLAGRGQSISLMNLLGRLELDAEESARLRDVKLESDALTATEIAAMKIAEGGGRDGAFAMLSDAAYHRSRASVMASIDAFRTLMDNRTRHLVDEAERTSGLVRNTSIVIGFLLALILLRTYYVLRRVMGGSLDEVQARIAALGSGDFSNSIVVKEGREESVMGWLAQTQRKLAGSLRETEDSMKRLNQSELQFRQLAENIREVFFLADATGRKFIYISPAYEELLGRTCASLYADPGSWRDAIHPEDRAKVFAAIAHSANGQFEFECRVVRPDETLRWIRVRSFPIHHEEGEEQRVAGFAVDTTHRTKIEMIVSDDDLRFCDVVAGLPAACFIANVQGRITYCNESALALTGWSRPELLGRPCSEIMPSFALVPLANPRNMPRSWSAQTRVVTRDGILDASTWRYIRLASNEGTIVGTAILAEAHALEMPALALISAR